MVVREGINRAANADQVVGSAPSLALDGGAEREAGVDIGERHDLGLAVIPAPAAEQADFVVQGLFEVDDVAIFDTAPAGLRDIEVERRSVQRLAITSAKGAVEPSYRP